MIDTKALRNKILDLAISGKLTEQLPEDGNAEDLYAQIQKEKDKLIAEGKIKKEKPLPPITEEEIPFEIPENWKWVRFSDLVNFYLGKTPARANKDYWEDSCYPWVSISDMPENGVIFETKEGISEKAKKECFNNTISKAGTLIMSFKLTIGKVALLGIDAYHNEAIISIFPYFDNDESIKHYLFRMLPVVANNTDSHGVVMGNTLNKKSMSNMLIPLPPLEEQKRIVSAVEDAFAVIDRMEKAQESYYADQEMLKNKIIDAGIRGKLTEQLPEDGNAEDLYVQIQEEKEKLIAEGKIKREKPLPPIAVEEIPFEIPDNWKWVRISEIIDVRDGTHDSPKYQKEGIPLITSKNLASGLLDFTNVKYISKDDAKYINARSKVDVGDILFAMIGTIGNPVLVKDDTHFCIKNVALFKKYSNTLFNMEYLYYYFTIEQINFKKIVSGGLQPFISLRQFREHLLPMPPLTEQGRIAEKLGAYLSIIDF